MSAKLTPFGMVDGGEGLACVAVAHVLHEQQNEDVILALAGVHSAAHARLHGRRDTRDARRYAKQIRLVGAPLCCEQISR